MKINSRTVHFFDLQLSTNSMDKSITVAPQLTLNQLIPHIILKMQGMVVKCGKTPIDATQVKWDAATEELVLLLNKPDPERSDVAYRHRTSKSRRLGNKALDEDIEVSSHVLIKIPTNSTKARMLLTIGAGIAPAKIVSLFNSAYTNAVETPAIKRLRDIPLPTSVLSANGKQKTYKVNHRFSFTAMPNGTLSEIIRTGKVVGLDLISTGVEAFDSTTKVPMDRMQMHVNLKSESVNIPFIKNLLNLAKINRKFEADQVRIEYREQGQDDAVMKEKKFDTAHLEEAFTRSELISLDAPHYDHQTIISEEIVQKMLALT